MIQVPGGSQWSSILWPVLTLKFNSIKLGSPPVVKEKRVPFTLSKDSGIEYIDLNAFCLPSAPFAPLIAAVHHLEPDYKWSEVDILTDRNGLRKLLRWLTDRFVKDFRIDLQLAGDKSLIFNRWSEKASVSPSERLGYGRNFEAACTEIPAGHRALGHHRIIEYVSCSLQRHTTIHALIIRRI
jgi:hypothetical protein